MPYSSESPAHSPTLTSLARQRRRSARRPFYATVEMVEPMAGEGVTLNASDGGLRVAVDTRLEPNEICLFHLCEPDGEPSLQRARVAWALEATDGWIVGLEIIGLH